MRAPLLLLGGVVLLAAADAGAVAGAPAALVERPSCRAVAPAIGVDPTPGSTVVRLTVAPVVRLLVDSAGAVVAAATNTGCAPRGDEAFLLDVGGEASPAQAGAAVATFSAAGDWTVPGRWVPAPLGG